MVGSDNFDFTLFDEKQNKTLMDAIRKLEKQTGEANEIFDAILETKAIDNQALKVMILSWQTSNYFRLP